MTIYRTEHLENHEEVFVQTNIEEEGAGLLASAPRTGIRIAVVGSRNFFDYRLLKKELDEFLTKGATLVSGGVSGADALAEKYARENGREIEVIKPDWITYGPSAGFRRNREIVEKATMVVAFWDGNSKGTAHTIQLAQTEGKPVHIIRFSK